MSTKRTRRGSSANHLTQSHSRNATVQSECYMPQTMGWKQRSSCWWLTKMLQRLVLGYRWRRLKTCSPGTGCYIQKLRKRIGEGWRPSCAQQELLLPLLVEKDCSSADGTTNCFVKRMRTFLSLQ